jgi:hypothetical protein
MVDKFGRRIMVELVPAIGAGQIGPKTTSHWLDQVV